jgi:hypothetical protein
MPCRPSIKHLILTHTHTHLPTPYNLHPTPCTLECMMHPRVHGQRGAHGVVLIKCIRVSLRYVNGRSTLRYVHVHVHVGFWQNVGETGSSCLADKRCIPSGCIPSGLASSQGGCIVDPQASRQAVRPASIKMHLRCVMPLMPMMPMMRAGVNADGLGSASRSVVCPCARRR